jgi:uncharacterized membrane protein
MIFQPVKTRVFQISAGAISLLAFGVAHGFTGKVTLCNRTPPELEVAVAYDLPGTSEITSQGWWAVRGCTCRTLIDQELAATEVFLLITKSGSPEPLVDGAAPICVHPSNKFTFRLANTNSAQCARSGGDWVKFKRYDTQGKNFTLNFRSQSTARCID